MDLPVYRPAVAKMRPMERSSVKYIIVHCSATGPQVDVGAKEINKWHLLRGFACIGYHWIIRRDGRLEPGRDSSLPGAHCEGWNSQSIGVCLVGGTDGTKQNKPKANFTEPQLEKLRDLLATLKAQFPNVQEVIGHRDTGAPKACPSFDVRYWHETGNLRP